MTIRKRRKKHRLRGERTHGHGNTKNARGAGTRGGRGKAGSHKHQFSKYYAQFGKEEKQLWTHQKTATINIDQIAQQLPAWAAEKKAVLSGTGAFIDAEKIGFKKVLARGIPTGAWTIKGSGASANARQKIEKAGGSVQMTGEDA